MEPRSCDRRQPDYGQNCTDVDTELALREAINELRDSIETGRMPSGIELEPAARAVHEAAISEFERLLALAAE